MIKTIVFDIGNVLSQFNYKEHFRKFATDDIIYKKLLQATVLSPEWNELDRGVWGEEVILEHFIKNDPSIENVIRDMYSNMKGIMKEYDYSTEWILELKGKGYQVLVLSNFSELILRTNQEEMKFMKVIDGGILSFREKVIKPDMAIYELLMKQYDLKAEECVFLDDREENIQGAMNAGWKGILFTTQEDAIVKLNEYQVI